MQIINVSLAKTKFPRQTAKFPDIPVKREFPDFPESGNPDTTSDQGQLSLAIPPWVGTEYQYH